MTTEPNVKISVNGGEPLEMKLADYLKISDDPPFKGQSVHIDAMEWGRWREAQPDFKATSKAASKLI